jgi:asparagine synthase (glutamine-hydrolysing)
MCGIAGVWDNTIEADALEERVQRMLRLQVHRGPDDSGLWKAPERDLVLGHRRLAVIDVSSAAHQPMVSDDGRHVLLYNGEIYNFETLRNDPALVALGPWRSTGDTEVLLRALIVWGRRALERLDGMFAIAWYDSKERVLLLARDPFGEKPLYLATEGEHRWSFSSTLPSLVETSPGSVEVDASALATYWAQYVIMTPQTAYRGIEAIQPGDWVTLSPRGREDGCYWEPRYERPKPIFFDDATARVKGVLIESLRRRLVADVPVGCLLSGGVDSSLVTALCASEFGRRLDTFSVGFEGANTKDSYFAGQVAKQYNTRHESICLDATALEELPRMLWHHGQPFYDFSYIAEYYVSKLARQRVTVALTGDGGDEMFGGYASTLAVVLADRIARFTPGPLLSLMHKATCGWRQGYKGSLRRRLGILLTMAANPSNMLNVLYDVDRLAKRNGHARSANRLWNDCLNAHPEWPMFQRSLYCEMRGRLLDNFLIKVDVAGMAHSLELRTPYLSRDLFDTVRDVGCGVLLRKNTRKAILKKIAEPYLPYDLIYRPKEGFTPPLGEWLKDRRYAPLMDWVIAGLPVAAPGVDPNAARAIWEEHLAGLQDHSEPLFALIAYGIWWRLFMARDLDPATPLSEIAGAAPVAA